MDTMNGFVFCANKFWDKIASSASFERPAAVKNLIMNSDICILAESCLLTTLAENGQFWRSCLLTTLAHLGQFWRSLVYSHVFSLYRNPDLDDTIFDCLLTSTAAVQADVVRASLLKIGDLNGHNLEWLGSTTTNRHCVATFDFATMVGMSWLSARPMHVVEHLTFWPTFRT